MGQSKQRYVLCILAHIIKVKLFMDSELNMELSQLSGFPYKDKNMYVY